MPGVLDADTQIGRLIKRMNQADDAALEELVQHSANRLESLARQMLRGYPALRRWVETDDVLQNALMRLLRALQAVQPESASHFLSLAALQIRRELVDLARHYFGPAGLAARHESRGGSDSTSDSGVEVSDLSHEPSTLAQWCELHEQLAALPDDQREVVNLLFYQGLNQHEAADVLGVSVRTVQRRWHTALARLHEKLHGHWPGL